MNFSNYTLLIVAVDRFYKGGIAITFFTKIRIFSWDVEEMSLYHLCFEVTLRLCFMNCCHKKTNVSNPVLN